MTLRYFYNLGIDYFRQNQFRMLPPPVPLGLEIGNVIGSTESSINEANDVRDLVNDLENKFNISSNASTNNDANSNNPKQRGAACTALKNENYTSKRNHTCATKHSMKITEQKNLRSRATQAQAYHSSVSPIDGNKTAIRVPTVNNNESPNSVQVHRVNRGIPIVHVS